MLYIAVNVGSTTPSILSINSASNLGYGSGERLVDTTFPDGHFAANMRHPEITGPEATLNPIQQGACHPSTGGDDYDIALIETQEVTSLSVSSDIAPFFYSLTPVLTVFYSPVGAAAQSSNLPQAHLSCVKVVQESAVQQVATNGADMRRIPKWFQLPQSALISAVLGSALFLL